MSVEENKALSHRILDELWNKGNLGLIDELYPPDYVNHSAPPGIPPDREGLKQFVTMYRHAFPDVQMTVEDQIAEGDKVVARFTTRATHTGELMGISATGKLVTVTGIVIGRYVDGKPVETWAEFDQLSMLQQLGVIPPSG